MMLKKLKRKFVALIVGILAFVLTVVFAVVCYFDWQTSAADAEEILAASIAQVADTRAHNGFHGGRGPMLGFMPGENSRHDLPQVDAATAVYYEADGQLHHIDDSRGMLSDEVAEAAQGAVADAPNGLGTLDSLGLVYLKASEAGTTYVAFADDSLVNGWQRLLVMLIAIEVIILIIFFFVAMGFARWALRPVEEAWRKQRTFVADASHELKTPLSIMSANTSILLDEPEMPLEERERWLESSMQAADGMQVLLNEMLDLASMDDGDGGKQGAEAPSDVPTAMEECDLSRMAMASALQFESVSYERGFALEEAIEPGVQAVAVRESVRKVIDILMDNACKYVNEGGQVMVSVAAQGAHAVFAVSNTGSVIPQEDLERVFDRFYRADESRTSGGHGLGLSIAQQLVHEMGGTLEAQSGDGMTTFTLRLKVA